MHIINCKRKGTKAAPIDINHENDGTRLLETFEEIGVYLAYGTLAAIVVFLVLGYVYHKRCVGNAAGYGNVKLLSLVKFLQSSGDFWTGIELYIYIF